MSAVWRDDPLTSTRRGSSLECDRRTADRNGVAGVGELSGQLHRSPVGSGAGEPGVFLGLGPCTLNGVSYPSAPRPPIWISGACCLWRIRAGSRFLGPFDRIRRSWHAGLCRAEALGPAPRRRRREPQRQLHRIALRGNTVVMGFRSSAAAPQARRSAFDRGNCAQSRRQRLHALDRVETPPFTGATLRALVSGWRASAIFSARSGGWLVGDHRPRCRRHGHPGQRDGSGDRHPYRDKSWTNYLSATAFVYPAAGDAGHHGNPTVLRALGSGTSIWRSRGSCPSLTRHNLELRFEMFNLLNNFNWGYSVINYDAVIIVDITTAIPSGGAADHPVWSEIPALVRALSISL